MISAIAIWVFCDDHLGTQIPERDVVLGLSRGASDDDLWRGVLVDPIVPSTLSQLADKHNPINLMVLWQR